MSVDKETVLPRGGHPEPRGPAECAGKCRGSEAGGAEVDSPAPPPAAPSCAGGASLAGSVVLAERPAQAEQGAGAGQGGGTGGDPAQPRDTTQVGPLRQNKRRHTAGCGFKPPGPGKRRRRAHSESDPVLPSNFLLGGNIFDPLNLNSLLDEEVNRAINAETPESSPLPAKSRDPVEILVPRDITDPLNLNSDGEVLLSPHRSGGRRRHRNRHHPGAGGGAGAGRGGGGAAAAAQLHPAVLEGGRSIPAQPSLPLPPSLPGVVPDAPREGAASPVPRSLPQNELGTSAKAQAPPITPCSSAPFPQTLTASGPAPATPTVTQQRKRRCDPSGALPGTPYKKGRGPGAGPGGRASGQPHPQGQRRPAHQQKKFQYGNYNKYYGYRNPGCSEDPRIRVMEPEWFRGKRVLDLGCNTGHLTLFIARNWRPARIVGLDIDGGLVHAARQNVRHYLSDLQAQEARRGPGGGARGRDQGEGEEPATREEEGLRKDGDAEGRLEAESCEEGGAKERGRGQEEGVAMELQGGGSPLRSVECGGTNGGGAESEADPTAPPAGPAEHDAQFPVSLRISRGPIAAPPLPDTSPTPPGDFPANVSFVRGNYVLESDALLHAQRAEYDVILCLSISKWVHLNWGDSGLQRLFRRVYSHLHPGGVFILEPQPWGSYGRRRKLTDTIYKNYHSIRLKPDQFCSYLTSEVGFTGYELLGTPKSTSRGFERPIYKFYKGPSCPRK
ncbi:LOW QUALITY PROTEIN: 7SK snRNA methylphosphate capping enzyme [Anguilla anguilla]|uniref:LOW QUALITY PROTEIN: 7SK snRNA methylphosphate capping enzyme n=1 Tax=Anguilla anguilla TaxID=7936 RepID=UPI0015A98DEA|nr:LOW QUALITY PROTEIN: 7SK snRNA methylphosphate capping enzyme [Anguilla anguilla]